MTLHEKIPREFQNYSFRNLKSFPYRLAFLYALLSIIWITCSDSLLESLVKDAHQLSVFQTYKGWFYVFISSAFILFFSLKLTKFARSEAQFFNLRLIDEAPDAIVLFDIQLGTFVYLNPASEKLFGYSSTELMKMSPIDISPAMQPGGISSAQLARDKIELALKGESPRFEWVHQHKNGKQIICQLWLSLFRYDDKLYIRGSMTDISDSKRLQNEVQHLQRIESIGQLAGGVAHDFNNLLTSIVGFAELAKSSPNPNPHLEKILESAQRGSRLTRQLLTFARKQIVENEIIDVDAVLRNLVPMIERLIRENIRLHYINRSDHKTYINIDLSNFEQMIINFCVNARDAIPNSGEINITLDSNDEFAQIIIQDTGVGIPLELQSKILEPFFTTKENGQGTGLGLAMCNSIIQQASGTLNLHSEVGVGTSFIIQLPVTYEKIKHQDEKINQVDEIELQGNETILMVEDDNFIRDYLEQSLQQLGYNVIIAEDGIVALKLYEQNKNIDLIITDIVMPNLNGKELVDKINLENPNVKIIFTSGYPEESISHHGVLEPGIHFIQKPFTREVLARKIRSVINES